MEEKEQYNLNYGYTTILAFIMNMRFNSSKKIEYSVLKKYPTMFFRKLKNYEKNNYHITFIVEDDDLDKFLELNKHIFTVEDKYVVLNENIPVGALYIFLNAFDFPFTPTSIYLIRYDYELKEELKLTGLLDILNSLHNVEEMIRDIYLYAASNGKNINILNQVYEMLNMRNDCYADVLKGNRIFMDDLNSEAYMYNKKSPFMFSYPVDKEMDYKEYFDECYNSFDEVLSDLYFYTIFSDYTDPARYRIHYDFLGLNHKFSYNDDSKSEIEYRKNILKKIMKERSEKGYCLFTPGFRTPSLFFLRYIMSLDEIQNKYDKSDDLELTKYKLIYLLDNVSRNLMVDGNIQKEYEKLYQEYLKEKNMDEEYIFDTYTEEDPIINDPYEMEWYQVLIKRFIVDLFVGELYDEILDYKKLAFIRTYYSITQDEEIITLLNKFSDHPKFWEYYSFIKEKNLILKRKKDE